MKVEEFIDPWQIALDILDGYDRWNGLTTCNRTVVPVPSTPAGLVDRPTRQRRRTTILCPSCHLALPATGRCGCDPEEGPTNDHR